MTPRESSGIEAELAALEAIRAPASLRGSIEELAGGASRRRRRRARGLRLAGGGAFVAALAVAVALIFAGGSTPAPTLLEAARVALAPATLASPPENARQQHLLAASVEGVAFPYWGGRGGWQTAGARSERLGGRRVQAVFYRGRDGTRVGYAIVAGAALAMPSGGVTVTRGGVRFQVLAVAGTTVLTWREAGHTCILAARGASSSTLLGLVS